MRSCVDGRRTFQLVPTITIASCHPTTTFETLRQLTSMPPPAILRLAVFYTMLLSSAEATAENDAQALKAEASKFSQPLLVVVRPDLKGHPGTTYIMNAIPIRQFPDVWALRRHRYSQ